jgi:hypothetical protein
MTSRLYISVLPLILGLIPPCYGQSTVDGTVVGDTYGRVGHLQPNFSAHISAQRVQTDFRDNESELNAAFGVIENARLFLCLTGNLSSEDACLEIFIDSKTGGESVLSGIPGNDGSSAMTGLTFDDGFEADYHIIVRRGLGTNAGTFDLDLSVLGMPEFSSFSDIFAGTQEGAGSTGTGPANSSPIDVAYDDSNSLGVEGGANASNLPFMLPQINVSTGFEMSISLADIGSPSGDIKVLSFLNRRDHRFASNQFLGSLEPPQANLGGDGMGNFTGSLSFDLRDFPGDQFFLVRNNDNCWQASEIYEFGDDVEFVHYNTTLATPSGILATGLPPYVSDAVSEVNVPNTACEDFDGSPEDLHRDVWFRFTPEAHAGYVFSTCTGESYNNKLAIYSGSCDSPVALACNDNFNSGCLPFQSELQVTGLRHGQEYLLQIGGFSNSTVGGGQLRVQRRRGLDTYCDTTPNSAGNGAVLESHLGPGSGNWTLEATGVPDDFCVFVVGTQSGTLPFFAGTLCISNPNFLYPIQHAVGGSAAHVIRDETSGTTLYFQLLFRDGIGGAASTSEAVSWTF